MFHKDIMILKFNSLVIYTKRYYSTILSVNAKAKPKGLQAELNGGGEEQKENNHVGRK